MRAQVSLEIAALHSANANELSRSPAFARDGLAAIQAKLECLFNRGTDHLTGFFDRPTLSLNLWELRYVGVDELGLVTLKDRRELVLAHVAQGSVSIAR